MPTILSKALSQTQKAFLAAILVLFAGLLLSGCGIIGDDDGGGDTGAAVTTGTQSKVHVLEAVTSNAINDQQQATGLVSRVFPADTTTVYAILTLDGVSPGMVITGKWFQLSVPDANPDGNEVSSAGVTLTADNVGEGRARVALNLVGGSGALPQGDWVVRVYADDVFIRTMGFVITEQAIVQQTPTENPTAEPTAAPTTEAAPPTQYTVQSGDTLNSIAEQFKPPEESTESFLTRLVNLNQLEPGAVLFVGQVLQIPGPQ